MSPATTAKQIVAKIPARVGLLADIAEAIREAGVNITALSAYERDGDGKFLIVTDDNAAAAAALSRFSGEVREKDVLMVTLRNTPGALETATRALAEAGINIEYVYGTTNMSDTATLIFKTSDDAKALGLL